MRTIALAVLAWTLLSFAVALLVARALPPCDDDFPLEQDPNVND